MTIRIYFLACAVILVSACTSMPFRPAIVTKGSANFPGIGGLLDKHQAALVVMVHGMCTHNKPKINLAIDRILKALNVNVKTLEVSRAQIESEPPPPELEFVDRVEQVLEAKIHFTGIIWSGLTKPLKDQLFADVTGMPSDCTEVDAASCKPIRARINGIAKDGLLNDCLADALVYQGQSRGYIQHAMIAKLTDLVNRQPDDNRPLAIVSASLGSKIMFDALSAMLNSPEGSKEKAAGLSLSKRLAVVYMEANQMPILGLADQNLDDLQHGITAATNATTLDPMQKFLHARQQQTVQSIFGRLVVVAFSDPNDLLSYRLLNSRYAGETDVELADVLVSNEKTYFKLLENPYTAHTTYDVNPDVARFIACGNPTSSRCSQ
jgi:hypothetical protein